MPDASVIIRQRLANAVIGGLISSNKTHSTMASIQKKLKIYGDAYKTTAVEETYVGDYTYAYNSCVSSLSPPIGRRNPDSSFTQTFSSGDQISTPASNVFAVGPSVSVTVSGKIIFYNSSNTTYFYNENYSVGSTQCFTRVESRQYFIVIVSHPIIFSFTTTQPQPPAPSLIRINRFSIRYDGSINGGLDYYDFSTYPTLPTEVYVIEVTSITDNIDGTEFTTSGTGNVDNYDSYWFTSTPSQSDIRTCMEDAYSSPVTLPASVIAVKAADAPDWVVTPPSSPPGTIFVLVLPYGNNGTSFDLIVKKQNV